MSLLNRLKTVQIQTNSVCNGKCVFCPYTSSWYKKNSGIMSDKLYNKIIDNIAEYDPQFIGKFCPYMCNEPLADNRIVKLSQIAVDKLFYPYLEISTNLTHNLVDHKKIRDIIKVYENNRWNGRIMVSFHGINKTHYERNMGLDYDKAMENLEYLIKELDGRVQLWIHTAFSSHDGTIKMYDSEAAVKNYWYELLKQKDLLHHNIVVYPLKIHNRSANVKMEGWSFKKTIRKIGPSYPPFDCPRFYRHLHIIYTGEVVLCCNDYGHESVIGDLKRQSIEEFFNSDKFKETRAMGRGRVESPDDFLCKRCQWPGA